MTRKTVELIIIVVGFVLEILQLIKDKLNGRKKDDDKRDAEKE
jgi:hypothetical protein